MYKDYLQELYGYDFLETEDGFCAFRILGDEEINVGEVYIKPDKRRSKKATEFQMLIENLAKEKNCKYVSAQVALKEVNAENRINMMLNLGYRVYKVHNNYATFVKEI